MYASNFAVLSASEILTPSTLSHSVTSCFASRRASETRTTSSVVWPVIALYATKPITAVMMLTPTETATMMLRFAMSAADQRLEDARVALERATLHVELKAAAAAELFTAAGAAGAAVGRPALPRLVEDGGTVAGAWHGVAVARPRRPRPRRRRWRARRRPRPSVL